MAAPRPPWASLRAPSQLTDSQITWISGTVAGFAATFAKQPIQRVKWIQQTRDGPTQPLSKIVSETLAVHGWRGFFSGSWAAVARNVPHSVLVYTFYPHCAALSHQLLVGAGNESFATRFLAGYVTMVFSTIVTHPLDTLRVRLSVTTFARETMVSCARRIYATDGLRGFYSGFGATLLGAGPRGAVGFAIFETSKPLVNDFFGGHRPGLAKFLAGYVAGLVAETLVYPLDTVRRRQQALGTTSSIGQTSIWGALGRIVAAEGVRGLFKGIALNLIKNPASVAVSFAVNDFVKEALGYGKVTMGASTSAAAASGTAARMTSPTSASSSRPRGDGDGGAAADGVGAAPQRRDSVQGPGAPPSRKPAGAGFFG